MKRTTTRALRFGLLILILTAASMAPAAARGGPPQVERPWRTHVFGTSELDTSACDLSGFPIVVCEGGTSTGTITGTHIGRGTADTTFTSVLDFAQECVENELTGVPVTTTADFVIVAADGSEVDLVATTVGCFVDGSDATGAQVGTYSIVGGTGRFAGATGDGLLDGTAGSGVFEQSQLGTIIY